ncbi:MAG TPA: aminoacyl-tRNA hydrolase [Chitinophagales bacterium]|jgi:PTH1 family peptidyl-tRNA hydrolase|nr:aminoacyl-tRNA hydrolase [Chitinophagales bacterium]HPA36646.1 aminoacyl-tRNA hydrolase [Chitinophagales bacterium]HPW86232.1 aminoacyl-tRNA hydrolase [Chitinophagales bacterium]
MSKYLIVGLGNIGKEYDHTRHNIGFDVADAMAKELGCTFDLSRLALYAKGSFKGRQVHLIKPTTYMNLSGKAIKYWLQQLEIPLENCLVIVDDLALPLCTLRVRGKGSDAGHNGLKSIQEELQTQEYPRLKFGIGNNFPKGKQVDFVLGKWSTDEQIQIDTKMNTAVEIVKSFCTIGLANTMNSFNNK